MKILHNPRCRKSRETLQIIEEKGVAVEIVKYLENPPSAEELKKIVSQLRCNVQDIVRKGESIYKEQFKGKTFSDEEWYKILAENPKLIERPIVIKQNKAIVGRPPENVLELL